MTFAHDTSLPWPLLGCPPPPDWALDWDALLARYAWLCDLAATPQDPHYHAEADVRGRMCADGRKLLERIDLFRQFCAELDCFEQPRAFASAHSRFVYFCNPHAT